MLKLPQDVEQKRPMLPARTTHEQAIREEEEGTKEQVKQMLSENVHSRKVNLAEVHIPGRGQTSDVDVNILGDQDQN